MPQTYNGPNAGRFFPVPNEGVSRRRFGNTGGSINDTGPNRWGTFLLDLSVARTRTRVKIAGTFLWAMDATSNSVSAQIAFKEDNADPGITFRNGTSVRGAEYAEIYVTNTAQAGATMSLAYAVEEAGLMQVTNPVANNAAVVVTPNSTYTTVTDVAVAAAATSILASDTTRRVAIITNVGGFPMRVGDGNVAVNRGTNVAVGGSITLSATAQIFAFGVGGATTAAITTEQV